MRPRRRVCVPFKVNVVILRGVNDDEILDFAAFARDTGRVVRFIEFMPLDAQGQWDKTQIVAGREIFDQVSAVWPLEAVDAGGSAPAERFRFRDGRGEIGLISSVTQPFCGTCNRLRLTSDGALRNCLFSDDELSVRDLIRDGAGDEEIARMVATGRLGEVPRTRHQRAGLSSTRALDVDDRWVAP